MPASTYPDRPERFEVCYHLLSLNQEPPYPASPRRDEDTPVPSVTQSGKSPAWSNAKVFRHCMASCSTAIPNLRRILTDYGFTGSPVPQGFPLTGYVEMRFPKKKQARGFTNRSSWPRIFRSFDFKCRPGKARIISCPVDEKVGGEALRPRRRRPEKKRIPAWQKADKAAAKKSDGKNDQAKTTAPKRTKSGHEQEGGRAK